MMGLGYNAKLSISITYIFLIGGSIASIWKNTKKQNIHNSKSYINIDLILLTLPIMSSGTLFGVIFVCNKFRV
jgi:glycerol-3-phosphate responsive antiterminator